jgi:hypothetical protein
VRSSLTIIHSGFQCLLSLSRSGIACQRNDGEPNGWRIRSTRCKRHVERAIAFTYHLGLVLPDDAYRSEAVHDCQRNVSARARPLRACLSRLTGHLNIEKNDIVSVARRRIWRPIRKDEIQGFLTVVRDCSRRIPGAKRRISGWKRFSTPKRPPPRPTVTSETSLDQLPFENGLVDDIIFNDQDMR